MTLLDTCREFSTNFSLLSSHRVCYITFCSIMCPRTYLHNYTNTYTRTYNVCTNAHTSYTSTHARTHIYIHTIYTLHTCTFCEIYDLHVSYMYMQCHTYMILCNINELLGLYICSTHSRYLSRGVLH